MSAIISPCGKYRYRLDRQIGMDGPVIGLEQTKEIDIREIKKPTLAEQLQALALQVSEVEAHKDYASSEIHKLRGEVAILWEVAYEGLERGAAFYELVDRRTGQTRERAERHFLPDNVELTGRHEVK